jgi:hypothetical protein
MLVAQESTMADGTPERGPDDADETARVAALVARAGLKLQVNEIVGLVSAYRKDRAGFERLREMLTPADETIHVFRAASRSPQRPTNKPGTPG